MVEVRQGRNPLDAAAQAEMRQKLAGIRSKKLRLEFAGVALNDGMRAADTMSIITEKLLMSMGSMFLLKEGGGSEYGKHIETIQVQHKAARQQLLALKELILDHTGDLMDEHKAMEEAFLASAKAEEEAFLASADE